MQILKFHLRLFGLKLVEGSIVNRRKRSKEASSLSQLRRLFCYSGEQKKENMKKRKILRMIQSRCRSHFFQGKITSFLNVQTRRAQPSPSVAIHALLLLISQIITKYSTFLAILTDKQNKRGNSKIRMHKIRTATAYIEKKLGSDKVNQEILDRLV